MGEQPATLSLCRSSGGSLVRTLVEITDLNLLIVPALGAGERSYLSRAVCRHDGSLVPIEDVAARLAPLLECNDRAALVDDLATSDLYRHPTSARKTRLRPYCMPTASFGSESIKLVHETYLPNSLRQSGRTGSVAGEGLSPGSPSPGNPCSRLTALRPLSTRSSDSQPSPTSLLICSSIPASASSPTSPILAASYLMPRSTEFLLSMFSSSTGYYSVLSRRPFLSSRRTGADRARTPGRRGRGGRRGG